MRAASAAGRGDAGQQNVGPFQVRIKAGSRPLWKQRRWGEGIFHALTAASAASVLALVGLIVIQMVLNARDTLARYGWGFVTATRWDPVFEEFGALPFIWGTVVSSMIALVLAVPVSLGVAVFLTEIASSRIRRGIEFLVEILASIPSVIYGLWGVFVLVPLVRQIQPWLSKTLGFLPLFQGPPFGFGMMTAGMILAIMILPIVTSLTREALHAVPNHQREASLALGSTRWETIRHAVLPYNKSGIVAAIVLGLGRALGETMAVTMVIGNQPTLSLSLFMPAHTMASLIANEFPEASDPLYLSALIEVGLLLFVVTLLLNMAARWLIRHLAVKGGKGS